ncbi:hypothetical protein ACFFHM_22465 [Halalkalibacter kiskunsagensis]|uniref:Uncharacterized protein n=1 Tax=Halalkalibacter kiskunsagensis TaxID=1548599 RepID=A0ABV6KIM4_9BACI
MIATKRVETAPEAVRQTTVAHYLSFETAAVPLLPKTLPVFGI